MELISAGHGPLLFYLSAEDRFRSYDAQGLPLGIVPQFQYGSPQTLTFAPGDIMVFVTDGLIEWSNAQDEEFGQGRLKAIIHSHRQMPAQAIISKLHEAVLKFAGAKPQADDLTVVIVKRKEGPRGPSLIIRDSRSFHRSRESTMSQIRFRYRYNEGAGGRGPRRRAAKLTSGFKGGRWWVRVLDGHGLAPFPGRRERRFHYCACKTEVGNEFEYSYSTG